MKNTITANNIFSVFAKLQLWFHLSHYYRQPGFYDGVDELIEALGNADNALEIILRRVMTDPDDFYTELAASDARHFPDDYEHDMATWIEECRQIEDLIFCIAVCAIAQDDHCKDAACLFDALENTPEDSDDHKRYMAVLSTMTDLRINVDKLLSTRKAVIA